MPPGFPGAHMRYFYDWLEWPGCGVCSKGVRVMRQSRLRPGRSAEHLGATCWLIGGPDQQGPSC